MTSARRHRLAIFGTIVLLIGLAWNLLALGSGDLPLYLKRIWRNRERLAVDRSAALFLGSVGASYIQFLRESIPPDADIVLAPGYPTGHEGIMEYFLLPRHVQNCDAPFDECAKALQSPAGYVLGTRGYSLSQPETLGYQWVGFPQANWEFQGFYAPEARSLFQRPVPTVNLAGLMTEFALGIALAAGVCLVGLGVACGLVGAEHPFMTFAGAFPLGAGLVTFCLFVLSWAGLPLGAALLIAVIVVWIAAVTILWRQPMRRWASAIASRLRPRGLRLSWKEAAPAVGLAVLVGLSLLLAVGLSYFEDDELAIWSTKGYGMVLEGTVRAGETWGAHGLSYPLNIPLLIGMFRMVAADQIPISKMVFPLYYACLLVAFVDFAMRHGVGAGRSLLAATVLGTIPLVQFHSTLALANLPLTVYLVLGSLLAVEAIRSASPGRYLLSGLFLALAAWTRAEAMFYALSLLACFIVLGRVYRHEQRRYLWGWIAPLILVVGIWLAFALPGIAASHLGTAVGVFGEQLETRSVGLTPLGTLLSAFSATVLHKERWASLLPIVGALALMSLIAGRRDQDRSHEWLLVAGLLLVMEVVSIFFIRSYSRADFDILVGRAIHRHLLPGFVLLYIGIGTGALRNPSNSRRGAGPEPSRQAADESYGP